MFRFDKLQAVINTNKLHFMRFHSLLVFSQFVSLSLSLAVGMSLPVYLWRFPHGVADHFVKGHLLKTVFCCNHGWLQQKKKNDSKFDSYYQRLKDITAIGVIEWNWRIKRKCPQDFINWIPAITWNNVCMT